MQIETDVLIVGGGIAACLSALALGKKHQISLIDKLAEPLDRIGESLTPAARRVFKQLDLLDELAPEIQKKIFIQNLGMQSYWGKEEVQILDHLRNPDGLGLNLDRKAFEIYLRSKVIARGVDCIWPAKFHSCSYENGKWHIIAKSTDREQKRTYQISAKLVIDASGRQSHFARSLGVKRTSYDKLLACWLSLPNSSENKMSSLAASEGGWWYSAVVPGNKRIISFQSDSDIVDRNLLKETLFISFAQSHPLMGKFMKKEIKKIHFHGTTAANSTRLEEVAGKQWIALGDAAMSFDPLSSQGMFHAMASAMQFSALINDIDLKTQFDTHRLTQKLAQYAAQMNEIWTHYLRHKTTYYRLERRWEHSVFWERRHK